MAEPPLRGEAGCAGAIAVLDVTTLGWLAASFGGGAWAALFVAGALLPAVALAAVARRTRVAAIGLTLWMLLALLLGFGLALRSGGGV